MRRVAVLASIAFMAPVADALAVPDGTTVVVDRPSGFGTLPFDGVSDASIDRHAISANGCLVVFTSSNDILLSTDEDSATNVYREDRCSPGRPVVQVNMSAGGLPAEAGSFSGSASISADGRYVAFTTDARNLVAGLDGTTSQYVVKDMDIGTVEIASRADGPSGALVGNGGAVLGGVISGNGRALAFTAGGVFEGRQHDGLAGQENVFVRYLNADQTYLVSAKQSDGTAGGGSRSALDISYFGEKVAFTTDAGLADTGVPAQHDTDDGFDAYVTSNIGAAVPTVKWVSFTAGNTAGATSADDVAISNDGTWIAWFNDKPWYTQCPTTCDAPYQGDFNAPVPPPSGQQVRGIGFGYSMQNATSPAAPTRVVWTTNHGLVAADTNNAPDVYSRELPFGSLALLTTGTYAGGVFGGGATDNGSVVVFHSGSSDLPGAASTRQVYARAGGQTTLLSQPEGQAPRIGEVRDGSPENLHAVSADGSRVVYRSASPFLGVSLIGDRFPGQVFVRTIASGATAPVSVTPGGSLGNDDSYLPSIDAAGRRIAFVSQATDLAPGVAPGRQHIYVRDLGSGTTTLVDRAANGAVSTEGADEPQISGDGQRVVFSSRSPDLPGADGDDHIYAVDLASGAVTQVDRTAAGTTGNASAEGPDISADGNRVAFISRATNLGGNTAPGGNAAYVKDLATGELIWASASQDGSTNHSNAIEVSLAGDGRRVAFADDDPLLGYGADGTLHVFVRDLTAQTTELASIGTSASASAEQRFASLNGDGTRLTFVEYEDGRGPRTYLRDLVAKTTVPLTNGRFGSFSSSLSASGTCAAFGSYSDDIVSPSFGPDFSHVYLRAIGGDCPPSDAGGPGPGPGPGPGASPDTTRPVISGLRMTNRRFAVTRKRTAVSARRAKRGTALVFRLSENARTTIAIARAQPGRRQGKRCVKPRKRLRKRCTRYVAVQPTLRRSKTKQGANRIVFTGRIGARKLKPGRYRASLVATDAAGNRSKAKRITFAVVRR